MPAFIDLSGQKFGRLTVLELAPKTSNRLFWLCVCDCGNQTFVSGDALKRSNTKSCGCGKVASQFRLGADPRRFIRGVNNRLVVDA